jgi:hypothetical protein
MLHIAKWLKRKLASRERAGILEARFPQFHSLISRTARTAQVATGLLKALSGLLKTNTSSSATFLPAKFSN